MVAAFGFGFSFWLHQGRIPRHTCRFYLLLAGAPKDEGDGLCGAPLLHPLDSTSSPRGNPLRRGITAAAVDRDSGFRYPVQILIPTSIYRLGALCSALYRSRFSRGAQLGTFVFHYWGRGCSFLRLRRGWAIIFRRICADREWIVNMADEGEENQTITFTSNQYGTVFLPQHRKLYPALSPRRRRMTEFSKLNSVSRSRTIFSGNGRNHIGAQSDLHKLNPSPSPV